MVSTLSRIPKRPNLNKTSFPSNSDKDLTRKKGSFSKWLHIVSKVPTRKGRKRVPLLLSHFSVKDTIPFQMTYKQMLQVSITFDHLLNPQKKKKTFDYLTKEGMRIILHFISFLLFNNHFQTSSVEDLRSSINIWWSLYWGKLLNPLEHKSLFRYT